MDALARAQVRGADEAHALQLGLHARGEERRVVRRRRLERPRVRLAADVDAARAVEVAREARPRVVPQEQQVLDAVREVRLHGDAQRARRVVDVVGAVVDAGHGLGAHEVVQVLHDALEGGLALPLRGLRLRQHLLAPRGLERLPQLLAAPDDARDVGLARVEVVAVAPAVVAPEGPLAQDGVVVEDRELLAVRARRRERAVPEPAEVAPEDALDLDAGQAHDRHPGADALAAPELLDAHAGLALLVARELRGVLEGAPGLHRRRPPRPEHGEGLRHGPTAAAQSPSAGRPRGSRRRAAPRAEAGPTSLRLGLSPQISISAR